MNATTVMFGIEETRCFTALDISKLCYFDDAIKLGVAVFILGILLGYILRWYELRGRVE